MYLVVGCGAFCAVTQGNRNPTDRLIRLKYTPRSSGNENSTLFPHTGVTITAAAAAAASSGGEGAASGSVNMGMGGKTLSALRPVVLVGKGVCYDTGGTVRSEQQRSRKQRRWSKATLLVVSLQISSPRIFYLHS